MKKIYIKFTLFLLILNLWSVSKILAQPGIGISYRFSSAVGVTTFVPGVPPFTAFPTTDDDAVAVAPPGMNLKFGGRTYQQFVVSSNGWVALTPVGAIPAALSAGGFLNTNQLSTYAGGFPLIAPFWDDLAATAFSSNYIGGVLWVRWTAKIDKTNPSAQPLFWVKIDGNTGIINFYYQNNVAYVITGTPTASIGIAGVCTGDFYSINPTTPSIDSTLETSNIALRPNNYTYTFTPYQWYDNCASAKDLGTVGASCVAALFNINNAVSSGSAICATTDTADVWFKIVKPAGISAVLITTSPAGGCQPVTGTSVEVFSSCGVSIPGSCQSASVGPNPTYGETTVFRQPCVAETLYIRVTADGNLGGKFNICVKQAVAAGLTGSTCATPNWICSIPFPYTGTTAGFGNDFDSTSSACHTRYMNGEDYVFAYTPPTSGCIKIDLTSTGDNPGVFIFNGCPTAGGSNCLGSSEILTGAGSINAVALVAGQTYYIVVDNNTTLGNLNNPFTINVTPLAGGPPANDLCSNASALGTIPSGVACVKQTFSTSCSTPSASGTVPIPSCPQLGSIPTFVDGVTGDVWLKFTAGFAGPLQINTFQSAANTTAKAGMAIYTGACGSNLLVACDDMSGAGGMPSLSLTVANGTTYYIRIWTEHPENEGNFDICFVSSCGPPNDLPCTSTMVQVGQGTVGDNTCANDNPLFEPGNAAQAVGGPGVHNIVWFSTIVPASGSVIVKVNGLGLSNTQIEGFLFPPGLGGCSNAIVNKISKGKNNVGGACGGGIASGSQLTITANGGDTLYIAVDGVGSATGTFQISFIDGSNTVFPPVPAQDCPAATVLCNSTPVVVNDPGYSGSGNNCDLINPPTGPLGICFGYTERNSSWYQFTVDTTLGGNGTISFDLLSQSTVDIDFAMWDITGLTNACQLIESNTLSAVACNGYGSSLGATGLSPTGTGGSDPYSPSINFSGGSRTYLMLVNSVFPPPSTNGYTLNWGAGTTIGIAASATWTGGTDSLYQTLTNWGNCGPVPTCGVDATVIGSLSGLQPNIVAGPVQKVRNLLISLGGSLTLQAGTTLQVCGDFTNNGLLICNPGSTIEFIGTGPQTISGFLTGANAFANLKITKATGTVQLLNDIDVTENFTTTNPTSIFNINGKYMKLGGNFSNSNGAATFNGIGGSTVEFYNSAMQNFTNTSGSVTLNRVFMNKPLGRVNLTGANSIMNIDSALTLFLGIITTRSLATLEVNMKYNLPAAINGENALSYIDGKLRRKISNGSPVMGSYAFPVGNLLTPGGYNRAVIDFTTTTTLSDLLVTFTNWVPPAAGPNIIECIVADYSLKPFFNNGYWTFTKASAAFTGNYNITLHNRGYTNNTGNGWTVAKADLASNPLLIPSWGFLGVCVPGSIPDSVKRDLINPGPSATTSFNHYYATVQTAQILPIELLYFTAEPKGEEVLCSWATASETNNQYFEVERSTDGYEFGAIDKVAGYGNGISSETRKYSFLDHYLCEDIRYYRLKQVDINGDYSYSKPVAINCRRTSGIELYPNPANTFIKYQFYYPVNTELTVNITDISGRIVRSEKINVQKGINLITNSIEDLAPGVYNLKIDALEKGNRGKPHESQG